MTRYTLQQAAAPGTLCRELREIGMLDAHNLGTREHTAAGRLVVDLRSYPHPGLGRERPYGKTLRARAALHRPSPRPPGRHPPGGRQRCHGLTRCRMPR